MDARSRQFADAGIALGLTPAKFKTEVANLWQFAPLVAEHRHLAVNLCVARQPRQWIFFA